MNRKQNMLNSRADSLKMNTEGNTAPSLGHKGVASQAGHFKSDDILISRDWE